MNTDELKPVPEESAKGELLVYQTENGSIKLEVKLENETVWLTQQMMAELQMPLGDQHVRQHMIALLDDQTVRGLVKRTFQLGREFALSRALQAGHQQPVDGVLVAGPSPQWMGTWRFGGRCLARLRFRAGRLRERRSRERCLNGGRLRR